MSTVNARALRRRYLPLGRVVLVIVALLQVPAWLYILHRESPPLIYPPGSNKQFALSQANFVYYGFEPLGRPIPVSHTASLIRNLVPPSIAHVYVDDSNIQFVFPKGPDVCVSVPTVVYGTQAVPKIVPC